MGVRKPAPGEGDASLVAVSDASPAPAGDVSAEGIAPAADVAALAAIEAKAAADAATSPEAAAVVEAEANAPADGGAAEVAVIAELAPEETVTVVLTVGISGSRDGEPWPPLGGEIDLPAVEAAQYIANGYAVLAE